MIIIRELESICDILLFIVLSTIRIEIMKNRNKFNYTLMLLLLLLIF